MKEQMLTIQITLVYYKDVICRVGGTGDLGTTGSCIVVNSNNTIIDETWIWRADHGDNTVGMKIQQITVLL